MKAKHGETRSERKKYRVSLHEHDIYDDVSIQVLYEMKLNRKNIFIECFVNSC